MPKDYLHDDDGDLLVENGDFVVGESTLQHQNLLLKMSKGDLRQFPKTGVGVDDFLSDDNPGDIYTEIQRQFEADGMVIRKINVEFDENTGSLQVASNAYYP